MGNGDRDPDRFGAKGPYPWVGGPRMTPAELETVAARHGLTMAEINAWCGEGDEWNCESFRDWWARMASIRAQSEDDRRRDRSGSWENAARQILFAAEVYGIRDLADEAMEVIAAELCRPSCRPARESV